MSELYKKTTLSSEEMIMADDLCRAMGIKLEDCKVTSYDHCRSLEELEFELMAEAFSEGKPKAEAETLAKEMAKELWAGRAVDLA